MPRWLSRTRLCQHLKQVRRRIQELASSTMLIYLLLDRRSGCTKEAVRRVASKATSAQVSAFHPIRTCVDLNFASQPCRQAPVAPASLAMKPVSSGSVFNVGNIKHDESLSTNLSLLHGGIQEPKKAHSRQNSTVLTARSNTSGSGAKNPEHAIPPIPAAFPQRAAPLSPFIKKASSLIHTVDARTVPNAFDDSSAQTSTSVESSAEVPVPKSSNALKLANIQQKLQDCRRQSHAPTTRFVEPTYACFANPV